MKYVYLVAAGALAAPMALAQSTDGRGWYGGVGYEYLVVDNDAINDRELDTLSITGGMNLNKSFGAEVTAATGIGDDSVNYGNYAAKTSLNHRIDLMGVARVPIAERLNLTGKLGVSNYEFQTKGWVQPASDVSARGFRNMDNGYAIAGEVGAEYALTKDLTVDAGYTYYDGIDTDTEFDTLKVGIKKKF
ncbi:outer membrane beta-barrel protein [Hyphomonas pacifica]|uniref:Outer membrane protein beta-barrel domain-containing protein n=1 Tax=Hyphomonas pacifica TaxID=1280941 RepID=A0A062U839_9PROT|nr:outer membrane beta-barrel protein [Hyphomonas pacifica]KCZ52774.1 hypothetical protein HY2_07525 [Hyphomonas pacifica]RAN33060.1 hypothetical protein HY3_13500 [Hyphomonas pacifica]